MGLSLSSKSTLVFVADDSRVIALTGQADVSVATGGSGVATLVELSTYRWKGFSKLR